MNNQLLLTNAIFQMVLAGIVLVVLLIFTVKLVSTRIRYEDYIKVIKSQGIYEDWKNKNHTTLTQLKVMHFILIIGYTIVFAVGFFPKMEHLSLWILALVTLVSLGILLRSNFIYKKILSENNKAAKKLLEGLS